MHQNAGVIHDQPLARHGTFRCQRRDVRQFPDPFPDSTINPFQVRFGSSRADHEKVGERRNTAQIEDNDVLGFLIFGQFNAKAR